MLPGKKNFRADQLAHHRSLATASLRRFVSFPLYSVELGLDLIELPSDEIKLAFDLIELLFNSINFPFGLAAVLRCDFFQLFSPLLDEAWMMNKMG